MSYLALSCQRFASKASSSTVSESRPPAPTVSVIIPVYCVEKYIERAVASVLAQTFQDFELILVDNSSPDESIKRCQMRFNDPRIQIVRQPNRGPSGSRNTGVRQAKGRYIAFLDGDDEWEATKLERHVQHLNDNPNVGISFCYSQFIDEAGQPMGNYMMPNRLSNITPEYVLYRCPMGNGSVSVYRREVFEAIKFQDTLYEGVEDYYFDERMASLEDVECWFRMAVKSSLKIEGIPEVLTRYRISNTGSSAQIARHSQHVEQVVEKIRPHAPELVDRVANRFRAYQYRFMARRLVTLGDRDMAVHMMHRALKADWRMVIEDPSRTLETLAAAYFQVIIPRSFYSKVLATGMHLMGQVQRRHMPAGFESAVQAPQTVQLAYGLDTALRSRRDLGMQQGIQERVSSERAAQREGDRTPLTAAQPAEMEMSPFAAADSQYELIS
jgi:Glycosyl transferase family 2